MEMVYDVYGGRTMEKKRGVMDGMGEIYVEQEKRRFVKKVKEKINQWLKKGKEEEEEE